MYTSFVRLKSWQSGHTQQPYSHLSAIFCQKCHFVRYMSLSCHICHVRLTCTMSFCHLRRHTEKHVFRCHFICLITMPCVLFFFKRAVIHVAILKTCSAHVTYARYMDILSVVSRPNITHIASFYLSFVCCLYTCLSIQI